MKKYAVTTYPPSWGSYHSTLKTKVYDCIKAAGETGVNRREIAAHTNLNVGRVSSYLAELKREGLVRRLGDQVDLSTLSAEDSTWYALGAMENALVANAQKKGITQEMEKAFATYNKIKALAMRPSTDGEARVALRQAVLALVKLVF